MTLPSSLPDMAQFCRGPLELVGVPGTARCVGEVPRTLTSIHHTHSHLTTHCSLQQLHSSVRTGNLETCLRLLSLGAQANFFHPEKGTTPLHVAAKAGQTLQAELLVVYGADPGSPDVNGRTPIDYAR